MEGNPPIRESEQERAKGAIRAWTERDTTMAVEERAMKTAETDAVDAVEEVEETEEEILCHDCSDPADRQSENGTDYCQDCYDDRYFTCSTCVHETGVTERMTVDENDYCRYCYDEAYTECYNCRSTVSNDDVYSHENSGDTYCFECYSGIYGSCDECNEEFHRDYLDDGLCRECAVERSGVHEARYKPTPQFQGKGPLYAGTEVEIECKDKSGDVDTVKESSLSETLYLKSDGSLQDGFEIVSHPMDREYITSHKGDFEELFGALVSNGARSWDTDTCGMHVHLSKNQFTTLHIYKLLRFVYDNQSLILRLSGRKSIEKLNEWANVADNGTAPLAIRKAKDGNNRRYEAINLQNRRTVEFRIFRGSLNPKRYFQNLDTVFALFYFTKNASLRALTEESFLAYVEKNRKEYTYLAQFLNPKEAKTDKRLLSVAA